MHVLCVLDGQARGVQRKLSSISNRYNMFKSVVLVVVKLSVIVIVIVVVIVLILLLVHSS